MKKYRNISVFSLIIVIVTVMIALAVNFDKKAEYPAFSSYSTDPDGTKGAYLLMQKLDFHVSRFESVREMPEANSVLIMIEPPLDVLAQNNYLHQLCQWVKEGNTLILTGAYRKFFTYAVQGNNDPALKEMITVKWSAKPGKEYMDIPYGSGTFRVILQTSLFTNSTLQIEGNPTKLIESFWDLHARPFAFYEYGRNQIAQSASILNQSPLSLINTTWQLALLQLVLAMAAAAFFIGKRLGPPIIYIKETVRPENEDILALASLMEQAGLTKDALQLYYHEFIREASAYFKTNLSDNPQELEILWAEQRLSDLNILHEVQHSLSDMTDSNRLSPKEAINIFKKIDHLRKELKRNEWRN